MYKSYRVSFDKEENVFEATNFSIRTWYKYSAAIKYHKLVKLCDGYQATANLKGDFDLWETAPYSTGEPGYVVILPQKSKIDFSSWHIVPILTEKPPQVDLQDIINSTQLTKPEIVQAISELLTELL